MALGDVYVFDDAKIYVSDSAITITGQTISGTAISSAVGTAKLMIEYAVAEGRMTFGIKGPRRRVANQYTYSLDLEFCIDDFDAVGTIDAIFSDLIPGPVGTNTDGTFYWAIIAELGDSTAVPAVANRGVFSGAITTDGWEPFGSGEVNTPLEQTRTFQGNGNITRG